MTECIKLLLSEMPELSQRLGVFDVAEYEQFRRDMRKLQVRQMHGGQTRRKYRTLLSGAREFPSFGFLGKDRRIFSTEEEVITEYKESDDKMHLHQSFMRHK
jgi:hypothetical protein